MKYLERQQSNDGSAKYLWELNDTKTVESVYFIFNNEKYACISSQVGCNVKCVFCETGKQDNLRNLTPTEILKQVKSTKIDLGIDEPLYQVAFAGMGEPLLNFENVMEGSKQILDTNLSKTISLSTSGIVPKIYDLVNSPITKLFISLHASDNETRNHLVPINTKYPIEQLLKAANFFSEKTKTKVTATYILFDEINDADEDLVRLSNLLDPDIYTIQLSVWNTISDVNLRPSKRMDHFESSLRSMDYDVFVLNSKGKDIQGGCGQLRSRNNQILQKEMETLARNFSNPNY